MERMDEILRNRDGYNGKHGFHLRAVSLYHRVESFGNAEPALPGCRIVMGSNPPTTAEGLWVIKHRALYW
jgi:hypothetical protein